MLSKVNVVILILILSVFCLSMLIIWLNHDPFLISLLFNIVSSLNRFELPPFKLNN